MLVLFLFGLKHSQKKLCKTRACKCESDHWTWWNVVLFRLKKRQIWIWKAYYITTLTSFIAWQCSTRDSETFAKMCSRLKRWNVKVYFSDKYGVCCDLILPELLIQTKTETYLIESNNFPQRHWFARFSKKLAAFLALFTWST